MTFITYPRSEIEQSITNRFEKVVNQAPERVAVKGRTRELTYVALNRAANSVARAVINLRPAVAEPVGLLLDNDDRAISTMLGVLKAGKFYVPLDASYPRQRLSLLLQDCQPGILIASDKYCSLAKDLASRSCVVAPLDELHDGDGENPGLTISADALAAVFYTSGSTGRPKGVIQTHRLVLHRVMVDTNSLCISPPDRLSLLSSPSYSVSLRHLFGSLLNGATVCPFNVAEEGLTALAAWLSREKITIYFSVPAVFRQLTGSVKGREHFSSLRVLHLGGEPVTSGDFELYRERLPRTCAFVNSLASNETGILRMFIGDKTTDLSTSTVPVGYEVDDKEILILGDDGRELGPGELGQITVRSEFLSPGYWAQPELTAAAFRQNSEADKKRTYLTGDLGTLLPDGCLIYRGRKDFRRKIRGIRVEVEETDAALRLHHSVSESVVVAREEQEGQYRLVAYVVPRRETSITVSELRTFLSGKLPEYMLPSSFLFLDALPLLPNGKVDRCALPPPDQTRPRIAPEFVVPRDKWEHDLAMLCEPLLGVQPIGIRDNFFDLGIDSLTILRLIAQIEHRFRRHLPPATLFSSPTIAQLADVLRNETVPESWSSLVPIQLRGTKPPFFWIHGDCSTVFLSRFLGADQPFYGLEHQGQDGKPALFTDVETIAAYYLRELRKVQPSGPYFIGGYSFGGVVALELAQQVTAQGEEVSLLALLDPPSLTTHSPTSSAASSLKEPTRSSVVDELGRHMRNVEKLSVKERLAYIRPRAAHKLAHILRLPVIERTLKRVIYRTSLALGCRLPVFVRSRYILDVYARALRSYVPQPYPGRVIVFKGEDRSYHSQADWDRLISGDCEMHVVRANHQQMREEPYVHLWAEALKGALQRIT